MSDPGLDPPLHANPPGGVAHLGRRWGAGKVLEICPLLRSADGSWRSVGASSDHRCWAPVPPAPLATAKQRQLCLTAAHVTCATYAAASGSWAPDVAGEVQDAGDDPSLLWPAVRSTPLALEAPRGRIGWLARAPGHSGGQALLVALMVLAFMVLVVARTTAPSTQDVEPSSAVPGVIGASDRPTDANAAVGATPSTSPAASPSGMPSPSGEPVTPPVASPVASLPVASATPVPSDARRYTVQRGDTLISIARQFGITLEAISDANGITNRRLIRIGQVLVIP